MAKLIFFDEGHEYQVDGVRVPSVSEVIRFMSREVYGDINQYTLDNAADRGTRIHKACEVLDKYGKVECDEDIAPYITAYVSFLKLNKPQWTFIEKAMVNEELGYAGTIDRFGVIGSHKVLLDIKSSYTVHKHLATAQLGGYSMLAPETPDDRYILHLKPDGTFKLIDIPADSSLFMACLTLHKAMEKKGRKRKSE